MAIKLRNKATGDVASVNNSVVRKDGSMWINSKNIPGENWRRKWNYQLVPDGTSEGDYPNLRWRLDFVNGVEWELVTDAKASAPRKAAKAKKVAAPQPEPEPVQEPQAQAEPTPTPEPAPVVTPTQPTSASMDAMTTMMATMFSGVAEKVSANVMGMVQPILENCQKAADKVPQIKKIEVRSPQGTHTLTTAIEHKYFNKLLWMVSAGIPCYLYGPAGSGKNVLVAQVAEALGLKFYYSGAISDEFKLKGYGDASGRYVPTEFYNAMVNGGLFMLDEMDASDPSVLVAINAVISQRYCDFPVVGRVDAHPDFRIVGAGNTFGTGANMTYTGRSSLDGSTLNRFAYCKIDYDPRIDAACAGGDDDLVEFGHAIRKGSEICGVSILLSYRQFTQMDTLKQCPDMEPEEMIETAITKGLQKDELRLLLNEVRTFTRDGNPYTNALDNIVNLS